MSNCYLCEIPLEDGVDSETKNHYEHIIPQALGGQLKAKGLLCKGCGGNDFLGGKIDKPFCDIFSLITERIDIKKDRITNSVTLEGSLYLSDADKNIDVNLKDNVLSYRMPDHSIDDNNKTVYIYANAKVAKSYIKLVQNEIKVLKKAPSDYDMKIISSLNDYLGILTLPFRLDNAIFKKGLTKIAIEYALSEGVSHETIKHLIDKEQRTIKCNNNVMPYFPIAKIEEMMENQRTTLDPNFMCHSLTLFSQRFHDTNGKEVKQLYTFIELFGTFQYYVELSSDYCGANIEPKTYSQRIIKVQNSDFEIKGDWKDLSIYANELGIDLGDFKNLNHNQICKKLQDLYNKKNKYIFDYAESTKHFFDLVIINLMQQKDKDFIRILPELRSHFYSNNSKTDFNVDLYRSRYWKDGEIYSTIHAIEDLYFENEAKLREYSFFKFKALEKFIEFNKSS